MVLNIISSFLGEEGSDAAKENKKYKPIAEVQLKKMTKLCANSMSKCVRGRCVTCMIQYFIYLWTCSDIHHFCEMFTISPFRWSVEAYQEFFNREILLVMREMESWICTYARDAGLPGTLHVVLLKWTMCILMARFNNVKNICVLKDFICQGGRPKNSRTCMLVGWGSRHFAAEAMELKVPDKVLICYFVLPTGVSILRYSNISILIKYSIFSGFYKKLGPFYKKKLRCDKFGHWSIF